MSGLCGGTFIQKANPNSLIQQKCSAMHPYYPQFLTFMQSCEQRQSAQTLESCFEVWLKVHDDVRRTHNAQVEKIKSLEWQVEQAKLNAVICVQSIHDYAIYSAIWTIELYCRHRDSSTSLQVTPEDRTNIEPVRVAWAMLEKFDDVTLEQVGNFGNMRIVYDKSKNPFFGRA